MAEAVVLERQERQCRQWVAAGLALVALALAALALVPAMASAKGSPAGLDKSFGKNGRAAAGFAFVGSQPEYGIPASWENSAVKIVAGPDGSTVIAGKHQIARFLPNGKLDPSFGQGGRLTPSSLDGLSFEIADVAFDGRGRLLVFGSGEDLTTSKFVYFYMSGGTFHPSYAVIARYTEAGTLDPSFGGGDGVARSELGLKGISFEHGETQSLTNIVAGTVDSQDRPIVAATTLVWGGEIRSRPVRSAPAVARFSAAGEWDHGFANGSGSAQLPAQWKVDLTPTPSGSILVTGSILGGTSGEVPFTELTALTSEGAVDTGFGTGGTKFVLAGTDVGVDPKGRLLVLQPDDEESHPRLLRLLANGRIDRKFGKRGYASLDPPRNSLPSSLTIDEKGRILIGGVTQLAAEAGELATQLYARRLLVGRVRADGAADARFGSEGWLTTGMGKGTRLARSPETTLDSQGRLVVADPGQSSKLPEGGGFLARYKLGG